MSTIQLFLLASPVCLHLHFFAPVMCWRFSTVNLVSHKDSLFHGWLFKIVLQGLLDLGQDGLETVHGPLQGP